LSSSTAFSLWQIEDKRQKLADKLVFI